MQLAIILVLVAVFAAMEAPLFSPTADHAARPILMLAAMAIVVLTAVAGARRTVRRISAENSVLPVVWKRFIAFRRFHVVLWSVAVIAATYGLSWPQWVRIHGGLDGWILLDELCVLAPALISLVFSWAAFYDAEHAINVLVGDDELLATRWGYVRVHFRHYVAVILAPLLLMLTAGDLSDYFAPAFAGGPYGWIVYPPVLLAAAVAFPCLLRTIWNTQPLPDGPLRRRLLASANAVGAPFREILVWRTEGRLMNAAASGFVRPWRYVFLTDLLLEKLTDDEIEAVFLHELGHLRQGHLLQRLAIVCLPLWLGGCALAAAPDAVAPILKGDSLPTALPLMAVSALYMFAALGRLSRLLEFEADAWAFRRQGPSRGLDIHSSSESDPPLVSALEKLGRWSGDRSRSTWLHPSISERAKFLTSLSASLSAPESDFSVCGPLYRLRRIRWAMAPATIAGPLILLAI